MRAQVHIPGDRPDTSPVPTTGLVWHLGLERHESAATLAASLGRERSRWLPEGSCSVWFLAGYELGHERPHSVSLAARADHDIFFERF